MHTRKEKLYDRVEGGPNTSVLMTPCWHHLFPGKRAQGWGRKKEYKTAGRCGMCARACVCVCVCVCVSALQQTRLFYLSVCTVLMWITILVLPLCAYWLELDTRDKRLHICACMSRITCSIECVCVCPPWSAYHSLCSLISFLSLLNGFLSLSPHHKCSLSPLLFFNTYKTESPGPVWATWKHQWSFLPGLAPCH